MMKDECGMMKTPVKKLIGITGAHGTGKTQAALSRARAVKDTYPELRVGLLMEVAAECPFPINKEATEDAQLWIFTAQLAREIEMMRHYDLIVCDRTPADAIAYTWCLGFEPMALAMARVAGPYIRRNYQKIIFRTCQKNHFCHADGRRDTDMEFRTAIESELRSVYRRMDLPAELFQYI